MHTKTPDTEPQPDPHQITAENAYLYSPDARKPRVSGRLRQFWKSRPRPQQVLLIVGAVTIVFSALMIGLSINTAKNKTNSKTSQSTIASNQQTNAQSQSSQTTYTGFEDENQNGIDDADETATTSEDTVSWWQKLLNSVSTKTDGSNADNASTSTTDTSGSDNGDSAQDTSDADATLALEDQASYNTTDESDWVTFADVPDSSSDISGNTSVGTIPTGGAKITIASWNIYYLNSPSNVVSGAKSLFEKADIIGFQELHKASRRTALRNSLLCSSCNYQGYIQNYSSNGSSPGSVSIIWKKSRFAKKDSGYVKVAGRQSSMISEKWIAWVKLQDKTTGKDFYMLNTHTVSGVESKGKPSNATAGSHSSYSHQMDVLTSFVKKLQKDNLPIFITGDFNVNYRYDSRVKYKDFPFYRLGKIQVHSAYQRLKLVGISSNARTHANVGSRLIDYVWSNDRSDVYPQSIAIAGSKHGSDHAAFFYTFILQK